MVTARLLQVPIEMTATTTCYTAKAR